MNLPNKLTIFRVFLVPVFVVLFYLNEPLLATTVFIIASFTDFLDGYIARKNNLITDFGKFMDPLADKVLVISALLLLLEAGRFPAWVLIVVITREFIVSGIRLVAADNQIAIAASKLGKAKTVTQMIAVILLLSSVLNEAAEVLLYVSTILTVISGVDYIIKNYKVFTSGK